MLTGVLEPLEKVHRKAAKIIHGIANTIPDTEILNEAKWKSMFYMYKRRLTTLTHQAYYERAPEVINQLVTKEDRIKTLRDNRRINLTRRRTEIGRKSFRHRADILWNSLPESVKTIESKEDFKRD